MLPRRASLLRTKSGRNPGLQYHVDLHLEVDPEITARESHEIATHVRMLIKETLPWVADVLVHVEPAPLPWRSGSRTRRACPGATDWISRTTSCISLS